MGVWSTGDIALTEAQMTGSDKHVSGSWRYERLEGPGHWMQLEAPDQSTLYCLTSSRPEPAIPGAASRHGRPPDPSASLAQR